MTDERTQGAAVSDLAIRVRGLAIIAVFAPLAVARYRRAAGH